MINRRSFIASLAPIPFFGKYAYSLNRNNEEVVFPDRVNNHKEMCELVFNSKSRVIAHSKTTFPYHLFFDESGPQWDGERKKYIAYSPYREIIYWMDLFHSEIWEYDECRRYIKTCRFCIPTYFEISFLNKKIGTACYKKNESNWIKI